MAHRRRPLPPSIALPPPWRRHGTLLITILIALAAMVCERSGLTLRPAPTPSTLADSADRRDLAQYHDRDFRVVRVVDGDTLDIEAPDRDKPRTRIRLWGVDTPEVAHGGQPKMYFGPEAKAFALETLDGHQVHVVLSPKRTRDKYGRLLAFVFLERGGTMFNELIIEEGFGYADTRFDHPYKNRFEDAEKRARRAGLGLWRGIQLNEMPKWRQKREHPSAPITVP